MSMKPTYEQLEQQLAAVVAENAGLKGIVSEINNELCGQGFQVSGWHLNGALTPLDNWFTDNGWGEPETPATDAAIANIQAMGVEMFADKTEREANGYGMDSHDWRRMMKVRADAIEFAAQLRQGDEHE